MCDGVDWPGASRCFKQSEDKQLTPDSLMKIAWLSDFVCGGLMVIGDLFLYSSKHFQSVASSRMIDAWSAFWAFAGPAAGSSEQVMLIKERLPSVQ
ncbi:hypothetical protein OAM69_06235 [bacterium]|nr:hypothetical protein [bacterium]